MCNGRDGGGGTRLTQTAGTAVLRLGRDGHTDEGHCHERALEAYGVVLGMVVAVMVVAVMEVAVMVVVMVLVLVVVLGFGVCDDLRNRRVVFIRARGGLSIIVTPAHARRVSTCESSLCVSFASRLPLLPCASRGVEESEDGEGRRRRKRCEARQGVGVRGESGATPQHHCACGGMDANNGAKTD